MDQCIVRVSARSEFRNSSKLRRRHYDETILRGLRGPSLWLIFILTISLMDIPASPCGVAVPSSRAESSSSLAVSSAAGDGGLAAVFGREFCLRSRASRAAFSSRRARRASSRSLASPRGFISVSGPGSGALGKFMYANLTQNPN